MWDRDKLCLFLGSLVGVLGGVLLADGPLHERVGVDKLGAPVAEEQVHDGHLSPLVDVREQVAHVPEDRVDDVKAVRAHLHERLCGRTHDHRRVVRQQRADEVRALLQVPCVQAHDLRNRKRRCLPHVRRHVLGCFLNCKHNPVSK